MKKTAFKYMKSTILIFLSISGWPVAAFFVLTEPDTKHKESALHAPEKTKPIACPPQTKPVPLAKKIKIEKKTESKTEQNQTAHDIRKTMKIYIRPHPPQHMKAEI